MILTIFLILFGIFILLILCGYLADLPYMVAAGFIFLFLLGLTIAGLPSLVFDGNGIQYPTGINQTNTVNNGTITSFTQTNIYASYTNHFFGILLSLLSILSFALLLYTYRGGKIKTL